MFQKVLGVAACAILIAAFTQSGIARGKGNKAGSSPVSVTGCLAQGDEKGEYSIKGDDGKTYGLRSRTVNLKEHMGHKVTVTGTMTSAKPEKASSKTGKPEESEHLRVTDLKMVSTTCP